MLAESAPPSCDTRDMVLVHRVFRREFAALPGLIAAVPPGASGRAARVGAHAREMVEMLRHHHETEDALLWPPLRDSGRVPAELLDRMHTQHEAMHVPLAQAREAVASWAASPSAEARDRAAAAAAAMVEPLSRHLDDEEGQLLPVAATTLTQRQWNQIGERAMATTPRDRLPVLLGYILAGADPAERAAMLAQLPPIPRLLFRLLGQRKYDRETAALRAG